MPFLDNREDYVAVLTDDEGKFKGYPANRILEDEDGEPDEFGLLFTTIFIDNNVAKLSRWFNGTDGIGYDVYIETDKLNEEFKFLLDAIGEIPILEHIYEDD